MCKSTLNLSTLTYCSKEYIVLKLKMYGLKGHKHWQT